MSGWTWLPLQHVASLVTFGLTLAFATRVLRSRRPAAGSTAWLLAIVLIPYLAIPLYLVLGDRQLRRAAGRRTTGFGRGDVPTGPAAEVAWIDRPDEAYDRMIAEIRAAASTIHISTFILGRDATGDAMIAELAARARGGVEVRLLLDGLFAPRFRSRRRLAPLTAAGGRVAVFLPLVHLPWRGRTNARLHRKLAVFDGARAVVGGMNLADEYMGPGDHPARWRDLAIEVTGPPARALDQVFRDDWAFATGESLPVVAEAARAADLDVVATGPDHPDEPWRDELLQLIFAARHRLWIATPYFAPDDSVLTALAIAARRGVDVTVAIPSRSNHWIADRVRGPLLRELAVAGVRVMRFRPTMLHAKCVLVDDDRAGIGSANFDSRSLFLDFEITIMLRGAAHAHRLADWFAETFAACDAGPPRAGWLRPIEAVARLLAPIV